MRQARNLTDRRTEFAVSVDAPFTVSPKQGFVEGNSSTPLTVTFAPPEARNYETTLTLTYGSGQTATVLLNGVAVSAEVHLDTSLAVMDPTYITLTSQSKVLLHNRSDQPVRFCWKGLVDLDHEAAERQRLCAELDRLFQIERKSLEEGDWEDRCGVGDSCSRSRWGRWWLSLA